MATSRSGNIQSTPQVATPAAPAPGRANVYVKADGLLYVQTSAGEQLVAAQTPFATLVKWGTD